MIKDVARYVLRRGVVTVIFAGILRDTQSKIADFDGRNKLLVDLVKELEQEAT